MHIYFAGLGGVGIGPLAKLAADYGYTVSGSTNQDSVFLQNIVKSLSYKVHDVNYQQSGDELSETNKKLNVDWYVHTSAMPDSHPELVRARELNIRTSKRDDFLNDFLTQANLKMLAVAGTHGKTTVTSMVIWIMHQLNQPLSYSVGTSLSFAEPSLYAPGSKFFAYECDEFDKNFLSYRPYAAAVINIDYDHPDTYPTLESYFEAFEQFKTQCENVITTETLPPAPDSITLHGHNKSNAWLAVNLCALALVAAPESLIDIVNQFPGSERRMELIAPNVYSDYGHHPTEIASTIKLAREINPNVTVVYQPHQNLRQVEVQGLYKDCFNEAKHVYWLPTYLSREDPEVRILTPHELIVNMSQPEKATVAELDEHLRNIINNSVSEGDLVLCFGAGSIDGWLRDVIPASEPGPR
jgi:UDP-N-acetylmuramate--alanine ligase